MIDIFVEKKSQAKPSFDIGVIFDRKDVSGDLGLEIEIEGANLPHEEETPRPWTYKHDGSLRGEDSAEYVLSKPILFDELPKSLDVLWGKFGDMKSRLDDSNRTSVHVHLNVQRFHLNRLAAFSALYFCVEDMLTHWAGEHRVGNLFCLRAKDAPAIVSSLKRFIKNSEGVYNKFGKNYLHDHLHYSGLNANALTTFGSLEVRTLRGVQDPKIIVEWVEMLRRLYELSAKYDDPRRIPELFSEMGPLAFFNEIMGPMASVLRRDIPHSDDQVRECMFEGIRLAQDLCYCRNWTEYKEVTVKADPFGRSPKRLVQQILAQQQVEEYNQPPTGVAAAPAGFPVPEGHFDGHEEADFEPDDLEF